MRHHLIFPKIFFFHFVYFIFLSNFFSILQGCSVNKVFHEKTPPPKELDEIESIYIGQFKGNNSILFKKILKYEIDELPSFKFLATPPEKGDPNSAIISAEVKRFIVNDLEEIVDETHITLVEKDLLQENPAGLNKVKRVFEFIKNNYPERLIKRILDLEISFKITNAAQDKILYSKTENISLRHIYRGEENILLIPDALDEMVRFAQILIQKFLDQINADKPESYIILEKGTSPLPWTFGMLDFGHPRIVRSNHYASGMRHDLALKGWNYVLFEPRNYPDSETFLFSSKVFSRLKRAGLPNKTLKPLFEIHNKSFDKNEINIVLLGLIKNQDFKRYAKVIKSHASTSQDINRLNLAAAHYNLGLIYRIRGELNLAEYHFARANSYNPHEKYSNAWMELQHLLGDFNPMDDIVDHSIETAGKNKPPEGALIQPKK